MDKFSIITPSFNQARFLPDNLNSLREQAYPQVEHIIVDPGSTDGSTEIARKAENVILIAEPDKGQSDGITKGFARSTGDFLAWLNSDDMYASSRSLELIAKRFNAPDRPDIIYGNVDFVDENGKFLKKGYVNPNADSLAETLQHQVGIVQPGLFMRRAVFEKLGGPSIDYELCMDYEYWVRMVTSGFRFAYIPDVLAKHRWWSGMKTASQRGDSYKEHFRVGLSYFNYVHVKWIHRYADYLASGRDGIIEAARTEDSSTKKNNLIADLYLNYNTAAKTLELLNGAKSGPLHDTARDMRQYVGSLPTHAICRDDVEIISESYDRKEDQERRATWRRYYAKSPNGDRYIGYHLDDKFDWMFDHNWMKRCLNVSAERFKSLRDARRKDNVIIVGNGPSLNKTDFSQFEETDVIISNFAILNETLLKSASLLTVTNTLVAEQSYYDINQIKNVTKIFPFWLAHNFRFDDRTILLNANLRDEFSTAIEEFISWRSTVSFFNMQLAYNLGYKKALLVGFDHFYKQPEKAVEGDVIDQTEDDENHFDPRYFRGKKWQAADTDNMEHTYELARAAFEAGGREIVNCTVGGMLEVFRRGDLSDELGVASRRRGKLSAPIADADYPKVLLFDLTKIGAGMATGEIKRNLFADWPEERLLQFYAEGDQKVGMKWGTQGGQGIADVESILKLSRDYHPEVILYRPVPDSTFLHIAAMHVIRTLGAPLVTWIVDDWPARLATEDRVRYKVFDRDFRELLARSSHCLSIGEAMSRAFKECYGVRFVPLANGVIPEQWPDRADVKTDDAPLVIRYAGGLADDMTLHSVVRTARAVETLARDLPVRFEIRTRACWYDRARSHFSGLKRTNFFTDLLPPKDYNSWLREADVLVIAYNFDDRSDRYIRYSIANKMPECLASGAAILAHGPRGVATIDYLASQDCAVVVDQPLETALVVALRELASNQFRRQRLGAKARKVAFERHNLLTLRQRLFEILRSAKGDATSGTPQNGLICGYERSVHAHQNETDLVFHLFQNHDNRKIIDVGAHFGSKAAPFAEKGWQVYCFEPDPANRSKLVSRLGKRSNVEIDSRAVSEIAQNGKAFYSSKESTDISGMLAFGGTHKQVATVDVTTVTGIVKEHHLDHIDFLKIDVEGYDFSVLKGVPWDRIKPDVIECEFEDAKTKHLGHTWRDICEYLVERGYTVYVSEWHPIIRYGIKHDWLGLKKYPCELEDEKAWGNLLAFKTDPGEAAISEALNKVLKVEHPELKAEPVAQKQPAQKFASQSQTPIYSVPYLTTYARFAEWLKAKNLMFFRLGQFTMWILRFLKRHALATVLGVVVLAGLIVGPLFSTQLAPYAMYFWVTAGIMIACATAALGAAFGNVMMRKFVDHEYFARQSLRDEMLRGLQQHVAANTKHRQQVAQDVKQIGVRLTSKEQAQEQLERKLEDQIGALRRSGEADAQTRQQMAEDIKQVQARIAAEDQARDELTSMIEAVRATTRKLEEQIAARLEEQHSQVQKISDSLTKTEERTDKLTRRHNRLAVSAPVFNFGDYQSMNRQLTKEHVEVIQKEWSRTLNLKVTPKSLAYLAHRICTLESTLKGRLATTIEDAILRVLVAQSTKSNKLRVLEIGTLFGTGMAMIYDHTRHRFDSVHLTAIDPLEGYYGKDTRDIITDEAVDEATFRANLAAAGVPESDYTLIKDMSTDDSAITAAGKSIYDMLIIDGDHSYAGVKSDFISFAPFVKRGGYIIFDDYGSSDWPDVTDFVDKSVRDNPDVALVGASWRTAVFRICRPLAARADSGQTRDAVGVPAGATTDLAGDTFEDSRDVDTTEAKT